MEENLDSMTDEALMSRLAMGEERVVASLLSRYQRPLFTLLRRVTGNREQAEDLFQETWIRVIRYAARFDPSQPFRPWFFQIAWNLARTAQQRNLVLHDQLDTRSAAGSTGLHVTDQLIAAEEGRRLRGLVAALPVHLAETILLRFFEELSEKEVARRLGVPIGTVKSRVHNALKRLAVLMERNVTV